MAETVTVRVTATDTDGATGMAEATITVDTPTPPVANLPTITSLTADDSTPDPGQAVTLTVTGLNFERVLWETSGGTLSAHADGATKQTFNTPTNIVAGTTYEVTVTLSNDHGTASQSITLTVANVAPVITSLTGIPQAPNSVTVGGSFTAAANANDGNSDAITYSWEANGFTQAAGMASNERSFTAPSSITGESNAKRTVVCTARDMPPSPYPSLSSSREQDVIIAPGKPSAPAITMHAVTQTEIQFEWSPPTDNGGSPITGYRVWIRIDDSSNFTRSVVLGPTIRTYTYTGLAAETPHEVAVEAFNTFTLDGNDYGQTSDRGTLSVTTNPLYMPPDPEDPNDYSPECVALTDVTQTALINPIESQRTDILFSMSISYSDQDGDQVFVSWREEAGTLDGTLTVTPQEQPITDEGEAHATFLVSVADQGEITRSSSRATIAVRLRDGRQSFSFVCLRFSLNVILDT